MLAIMTSVAVTSFSQNDVGEEYEKFRQQMMRKYDGFRSNVNKKYADFFRQAWEEYKQKPAIPKPKDEKRPPVVMPEDNRMKPIKDNLIVIKEVVTPPAPQRQPKPIAPIKEQPQLQEKTVAFMLYETYMNGFRQRE